MAARKLTTRFIDSIKPPKEGRVEYWDTAIPGFGLRVSQSGRRTWTLMYRHHQRVRRLSLGVYPALSLADARGLAQAALREVAAGRDPAADKTAERAADTFGELAEKYIERYAKPRKRSWKEDRRALDRDLLPRFKNRKAASIRRREIIECLEAIKTRGAPVLANRTLEIIRRIYNWGIAQEIVEANPCALIERPGIETPRDRVLNDDEIRSVWAALDKMPKMGAGRFKLLFLTASRPGEIRQMRWQDIDQDWWIIPAEFSKNRLSHRVPLTPLALEVLSALPHEKDQEWVFPSTTGTGPVSSNMRALATLRTACKVDFRAHDIRRTVATRLTGDLGINRLTVSKILNHVERGVTGTYDRHSYDAEKRRALKAWGQRLGEILDAAPTASNVVELASA